MELRSVQSRRDRQAYLQLPDQVYRGYPAYRGGTEVLASIFLMKKSAFFNYAQIRPFVAWEGREPLMRASLIWNSRLPQVMQIGFFEALPQSQSGVELLIQEAREWGQQLGCEKIVAPMQGHINNGLGFLADGHETPTSFGIEFTPPYYLDFFPGQRRQLHCYQLSLDGFTPPKPRDETVQVRPASMKHLREEVALYTHMNNTCFAHHPWWADRTFEEDWELFYPFRHFIKGENLLFAEIQGEPAGFLFWYPDFHQLMEPGERLGLRTLLRYRLGRPITRLRIAEIGVVPKYSKGRGVTRALLYGLHQVVQGRGYRTCEGSFISEENRMSRLLLAGFPEMTPSRTIAVMELPI